MFQIYLRDIPTDDDVTPAVIEELAEKSEHYSNADIAAVVDEAKLMAIINTPNGEKRVVTADNLLSALERVESSITPEDLDSAQNFMKVYKVRKT